MPKSSTLAATDDSSSTLFSGDDTAESVDKDNSQNAQLTNKSQMGTSVLSSGRSLSSVKSAKLSATESQDVANSGYKNRPQFSQISTGSECNVLVDARMADSVVSIYETLSPCTRVAVNVQSVEDERLCTPLSPQIIAFLHQSPRCQNPVKCTVESSSFKRCRNGLRIALTTNKSS